MPVHYVVGGYPEENGTVFIETSIDIDLTVTQYVSRIRSEAGLTKGCTEFHPTYHFSSAGR
jgi:hypothetical protein